MTIVAVPCSHTMRQKSGMEAGTGPIEQVTERERERERDK